VVAYVNCQQPLLGIRALHEKNLVHRDIKTANILVTKDAGGRWFVQICDLDTIVEVKQDGTIAVEDGEEFVMGGGSYVSEQLKPFIRRVHDCGLYLIAVGNKDAQIDFQLLQSATNKNIPVLVRVSDTHQYKIYGQEPRNKNWKWIEIVDIGPDAQHFLDSLTFDTQILSNNDLFENQYIKQILSHCHSAPLRKKWVRQTPENLKAYKELNLKADDCFALSIVLEELIRVAAPGQILKGDSILDLRYSLGRTLPKNRGTIEAALTHPFFGFRDGPDNSFTYHSFCAPLYSIKDERYDPSKHLVLNNFFKELLERKSPVEFIGKYRAETILSQNPFLLVQENLREVYVLLEKLDNQLNYISIIFDCSFREKRLDVFVHGLKMSLDSLDLTVKELNTEINKALENYQEESPVGRLLREIKDVAANAALDNVVAIQLPFIKAVVEAIEKNNLIDAATSWKDIDVVMVKNHIAKFLKNDQLLTILKMQPNYRLELNCLIDVLEQAIEEAEDKHVASMANEIVDIIKFPDTYALGDNGILLITELAHRMLIGLNHADLADNVKRMRELAEIIPQCSPKLGQDLKNIILRGVNKAKLSGLSASWIFSGEPPRARADSEEKQMPASELTRPTLSI